jgi:hypothetical protein
MPIRLTRTGAVLGATTEEIEQLRDAFRADQFLRLRRLLEPGLLQYYVDEIGAARFEERVHEGIGKELWLHDPRLARGLEFLFNDPLLLELVEKLAGCGPVRSFDGRVYRFPPDDEDEYFDSWHDDLGDDRLVALSLNLSPEPYLGGTLEIRNRHTELTLAEVDNPVLGDAVLFRLGEDLQHRVTPLRGGAARTAFAGWFRSQPDYGARLAAARERR